MANKNFRNDLVDYSFRNRFGTFIHRNRFIIVDWVWILDMSTTGLNSSSETP